MYTSKCENILFSVDTLGIATVTLHRPEQLNALSWDMERELGDIFSYCSHADEVRVVILTGAGKHFCAGGDVKRFKQNVDAGVALAPDGIRYMGSIIREMRSCSKPIIAKVNGAAVGAGAALAFASDFRVLEPRSKLGAGFTSMGLSGDSCGWYTLSRIVSLARAAQFYMLAETLTAEQADRLGIVTRVSEEGKLDEAAMELGQKLANSPTQALAYQKKMFNLIEYSDIERITAMEECFVPACTLTADHAEAVNSFLEKRQPKFIGK